MVSGEVGKRQSSGLLVRAFEGCRSDFNGLRWEDFFFFSLVGGDKNE